MLVATIIIFLLLEYSDHWYGIKKRKKKNLDGQNKEIKTADRRKGKFFSYIHIGVVDDKRKNHRNQQDDIYV